MAVRSAIKKTGYNVNTMQEILFRNGSRSFSSGSGSQSGKMPFEYVTADYIADVTIPGASYRIDVKHGLLTQVYAWSIFKTDDSRAILVVDWWQGEEELQLWFMDDGKSITVIIDP